MSGTVCSYSGCKRSYSADKDVSFFPFPGDPKRRKKWMDNCGNTDLKDMDDRQLRRNRICSDHFIPKAFSRPESRTALNDTAVPIPAKKTLATKQSTPVPVATKSSASESAASATPKSGEGSSKKPAKKSEIITRAGTTELSKPGPEPSRLVKKATRKLVSSSDAPKMVKKVVKSDPPCTDAPKLLKKVVKTDASSVGSPKGLKKVVKTLPSSSDAPKIVEKVVKSDPPNTDAPKMVEKVVKSDPPNTDSPKIVEKVVKSDPPITDAPKMVEKVAKSDPTNTDAPKMVKKVVKSDPPNTDAPKLLKKVVKTDASSVGVPKVLKKVVRSEASSSDAPKMVKKVVKSDSPNTDAPKLLKKVVKTDASSVGVPKMLKKVVKTLPSSSDAPKTVKKVVKSDPPNTDAPKLLKKVVKTDASSVGVPKVLKKVVKSEASRPKLPFYPDACTELATLDSQQGPDENLFEGFYVSLKRFLKLSGRWTIGGVQWDPQGKRKVIMVSEPEISPNGRPCVKRCLQFFEDKALKVFIDGLDMTDVFEMNSYADKEDVAALICRVAEASSCCGVPEMISDDLPNFPNAKKRSTSYFDSECPGIIPNDSFDAICSSCKKLRSRVLECRQQEKKRLNERRIRSQEKEFRHPFGEALYSMFGDLVDETDPSKPKKKRTKETFFRKFLTDTRYKMNGDAGRTERIYVEKPISVDSVSQSFQDIVSKLGFSMPNAQKKPSLPGSAGQRPSPSTMLSTPRPRIMPGSSGMVKVERKMPMMEHMVPFTPGSSFTFDDGQEYELIAEVEPGSTELVEMKPNPNQYEIIEVDDETLAKLASSRNQVVMLPEAAASSSNIVTRIDANDPNLSQILKAINTSHGFKVT